MFRRLVCNNARIDIIEGLIASFNLPRQALLPLLSSRTHNRGSPGRRTINNASSVEATKSRDPVRSLLASYFPISTSQLSPRRILHKLPSTRVAHESIPIAVLLLTPSLMPLLSEDDAFVSKALCKLFKIKDSTVDHTCDAVVAVVDKLPVIEARVHGQQSNFNGVLDKGREGLAILVGDSGTVAPNLWEPPLENRTVDTRSLQQKNTICFQLCPGRAKLKPAKFRAPQIEPTYMFRSFQVPLANTVFHNGQKSTMYASRWTRESASDGIVRTKRTNIWNQLVKLPQHIDNRPTGRMALWIPLAPLTPPRQVAAAVGNIIRLFYLTDHTSKTVPASEELEHRIKLLSESVGLDQQRVAVWALITPRGRWSSEPTLFNKIMHHKLEQGSRLHRVLSGGGGWGQKQGLLSLDPESSCCADGKSTTHRFGTGESFDQEEKEALGEVVKPGDLVQFFTTTTQEDPRPSSRANVQSADEKSRTLGYEAPNANNVPVAIEFGTIPSTIDEMPKVTSSESDSAVSDNIEVAVNHFGALSEQGISMSITSFTNDTSEWAGAQRVGQVVQTKVDVPHSKFNYTAFDLDFESLISAKQQSSPFKRRKRTFRRLSFLGERGPRRSKQQDLRKLEGNGVGKDQEQSTGPAANDMREKMEEWLKKAKLSGLSERPQQE